MLLLFSSQAGIFNTHLKIVRSLYVSTRLSDVLTKKFCLKKKIDPLLKVFRVIRRFFEVVKMPQVTFKLALQLSL